MVEKRQDLCPRRHHLWRGGLQRIGPAGKGRTAKDSSHERFLTHRSHTHVYMPHWEACTATHLLCTRLSDPHGPGNGPWQRAQTLVCALSAGLSWLPLPPPESCAFESPVHSPFDAFVEQDIVKGIIQGPRKGARPGPDRYGGQARAATGAEVAVRPGPGGLPQIRGRHARFDQEPCDHRGILCP